LLPERYFILACHFAGTGHRAFGVPTHTARYCRANEVVNQWFGDFYRPTDKQFESKFSDGELASLREFDAVYDAQDAVLPDSLDEMLKSKA
jgi:hypothetical protein